MLSWNTGSGQSEFEYVTDEEAMNAGLTLSRMEGIIPAIESELLEMTIPEKPNSKHQRYIITEKGKEVLNQLSKDNE